MAATHDWVVIFRPLAVQKVESLITEIRDHEHQEMSFLQSTLCIQ